MSSVTLLLEQWGRGNQRSFDELYPLVEQELRLIAARYMRKERRDHTLQTTALVNEAYLKLVERPHADFQNRAHFFAISARIMRQILVDYARRSGTEKRGGQAAHMQLDEGLVFSPSKSADLLALEDALLGLAEIDPRKAQVVELRYFGGLNVEETAEVLKVHANTVIRDWALAKAWLKKEIESTTRDG
ncbi:MAG TPA: sigma-70 family RNA polymerase sigma factor [Bryobacteraceae bacterium]|nr:sigma-70 family RNA polymerase sigma factor [Bryobacteraceae bacterium]